MTNEQAFLEFQFAVNQWFKYMDRKTREKAVAFAQSGLVLPSEPIKHHVPAVKKPVEDRRHHWIGTIWMLNRETGERARVKPSEVVEYETKGFIRRGIRGN
jgi:hypothetical protein